jgi:DNA-binding CsgD family transcriptional regulator
MAATYLEVQAAVAADARDRHALPEVSGARQRGKRVLTETETVVRASGVPAGAPSRLETDANLATARAYSARLDGRDDPVLWDAAAQAWERAGEPYQVARARWRQAESSLPGRDARVARAAARGPLLARPLLRALVNLAGRAMIAIPGMDRPEPTAVGPGPTPAAGPSGGTAPARGAAANGARPGGAHGGEPISARADHRPARQPAAASGSADQSGIAAAFAPDDRHGTKEAFGLSRRELEVLALIAEGRTTREIGERLFISQKTVAVHIGNILSKLGASGRVEAAMVAIRLELVPTPQRREGAITRT